MNKLALVTLSAAAIAGCATTPVPADKLARSQAAVKSAEELNADADPQAALHLRLAREQLATARRMMVDGKSDRAKFVLMRAEADAEAALNMARAKSARIEAARAMQDVQQVRTQMQMQMQMQQPGGSQ